MISASLVKQFNQRSRVAQWVTTEQLQTQQAIDSAMELRSHAIVVNLTASSIEHDQQLLDQTIEIASYCARHNYPLIHLSSSLVFLGKGDGEYKEGDDTDADSDIAQRYVQLEDAVSKHAPESIILRVGPCFSYQGNNVLTELLDLFQKGGEVELSTSGTAAPITSADLARVISGIIDQVECDAKLWGVYHYCSSDPVSQYQFGETIFALLAQYTDVGDVTLAATEAIDSRWLYPRLETQKIREVFGIKPLPWRASASKVVKEYFNQDQQAADPIKPAKEK